MLNKNVVVVSGFSASGKGTILKEVLKRNSQLKLAVSCTTRLPRDEEETGYRFLSEDEFEKMSKYNQFLEENSYAGYRYATSVAEVEDILGNGLMPVLEVDTTGLNQIILSKKYKVKSVFIATDADTIFERLVKRNSNSVEEIILRMKTALEESRKIGLYDVVLINDKVGDTVLQLEKFIRGEDIGKT